MVACVGLSGIRPKTTGPIPPITTINTTAAAGDTLATKVITCAMDTISICPPDAAVAATNVVVSAAKFTIRVCAVDTAVDTTRVTDNDPRFNTRVCAADTAVATTKVTILAILTMNTCADDATVATTRVIISAMDTMKGCAADTAVAGISVTLMGAAAPDVPIHLGLDGKRNRGRKTI